MPRFTDRFIAALKAAPSRAEHVDSACKGLTIRVAPSGKKSWAYRYKRDGKTVRITLGEYPAMTLAEATVAANKRRIDLLEGRNPKAERQKEVIESINAADELQFEVLADRFVEEYAKPRKRSWQDDKWVIEKFLKPAFKGRVVSSIRRKEIVQLLRKLALTSVRNANKTQATLCTIYNWINVEDETIINPIARIPKQGGKEREEDRVLTDDELRLVWPSLIAPDVGIDESTGIAVRLIFLTAQRPLQVSGMRLDELVSLDGDKPRWDLPASRMKRNKPHSVPLSAEAVAHIKRAIELRYDWQKDSPFVFPAPRSSDDPNEPWKPINRAALSKAVLRLRGKLKMSEWSPHDARRSATTWARTMGIPRDVTEALTHHAIVGSGKAYDRYDQMNEKREAANAIWNYVRNAISRKSNVEASVYLAA